MNPEHVKRAKEIMRTSRTKAQGQNAGQKIQDELGCTEREALNLMLAAATLPNTDEE